MEFHSDPQLRGQLCVLAGRIIATFLTTKNLVTTMTDDVDQDLNWPDWTKAQMQLERLLIGLDTLFATEVCSYLFVCTLGSIVKLYTY